MTVMSLMTVTLRRRDAGSIRLKLKNGVMDESMNESCLGHLILFQLADLCHLTQMMVPWTDSQHGPVAPVLMMVVFSKTR